MTPLTTMTSEKIRPHHRDRTAVVYIRQSTPQQVERHQESARLQYALVDYALLLGWDRERISVIDDDQGRTGATADGRLGFQRLVADVGLGRVGLVLGIEMSRLARSCCDWHQLIEICALRGTLLADAEGVYDANCMNDRLLLGLKATISEAELHLIKARMNEGRRIKAQRGDLITGLPRGYVRRLDGSVMMDPDEQVQATIHLVFTLFERCGSTGGVLRHLVDHDIRLPDRLRTGAAKGELEWRRPNRPTLIDMLHNPIYARCHAYGRRSVEASRRQPGQRATGRRRGHDLDDGVIVLHDRLPAYISWDRYVTNLEKMAANRSEHLGVPRHGPALLSGLLVCGRCGHRMFTAYKNNGPDLRYFCGAEYASYAAPICQTLAGRVLDEHITGLVLQAMMPSALETSLQLAEDLELERVERHRQWKLRLERARYDAERARRQYSAVEPENRLVARTLEAQWEDKLRAVEQLEREYESWRHRQQLMLDEVDRDQILALAQDLPCIWSAPTTTPAERKQLLRLLIHSVLLDNHRMIGRTWFQINWRTGASTEHSRVRRVRGYFDYAALEELKRRIRELHAMQLMDAAIASALNEEGFRTSHGQRFTGPMLHLLRKRWGL